MSRLEIGPEEWKDFAEMSIVDDEKRGHLTDWRDTFLKFVKKRGYSDAIEKNDYYDSINLNLFLKSDYRGIHLLTFIFTCSVDEGEVSFEVRFNTPNEERMAHKLFMDLHNDYFCVYRNESINSQEIKWSLEIWEEDKNIEIGTVERVFDLLKDKAAYVISKMESAYYLGYKSDSMYPVYHKTDWLSYPVYEGDTNLGKRVFIDMDYDEDLFIDIPASVNKVYMAYYALRDCGPEYDMERVEEKYELQLEEETFRIVDATKKSDDDDEICLGKLLSNRNIVFRMACNDEIRDLIIYKDKDEVVKFFLREGEFSTEYARIEKNDTNKYYHDKDDTQLYEKYDIKTSHNIGKRVGLLFVIASLIMYE